MSTSPVCFQRFQAGMSSSDDVRVSEERSRHEHHGSVLTNNSLMD
ncbi:MAG: hypothetical protein RH917_05695 [Lacipirellulaceae bacterium]